MADLMSTIIVIVLASLVSLIGAHGFGNGNDNGNGNGNGNGYGGAGQWIPNSNGGFPNNGGNFPSRMQSNEWQKSARSSGSGGGGGGGSTKLQSQSQLPQYSSNNYDTGNKYGYDYTIPGANVHFAAFRGAMSGGSGGAFGNGNGNGNGGGGGGVGGGNGWNNFARKQWSRQNGGGNDNARQRDNFANRNSDSQHSFGKKRNGVGGSGNGGDTLTW